MRRSLKTTQDLEPTNHLTGVSSEKENVHEETNNQKATFAGKETLSKLYMSRRAKEENIYRPELSKNLLETPFKISGGEGSFLSRNDYVSKQNANLRREIEAEQSFKSQSYFASGKVRIR